MEGPGRAGLLLQGQASPGFREGQPEVCFSRTVVSAGQQGDFSGTLPPPQPGVGSVLFWLFPKGRSAAVTSLVPFRPACQPWVSEGTALRPRGWGREPASVEPGSW